MSKDHTAASSFLFLLLWFVLFDNVARLWLLWLSIPITLVHCSQSSARRLGTEWLLFLRNLCCFWDFNLQVWLLETFLLPSLFFLFLFSKLLLAKLHIRLFELVASTIFLLLREIFLLNKLYLDLLEAKLVRLLLICKLGRWRRKLSLGQNVDYALLLLDFFYSRVKLYRGE